MFRKPLVMVVAYRLQQHNLSSNILGVVASQSERSDIGGVDLKKVLWSVLKCLMHFVYCTRCFRMCEHCVDWFIFLVGKLVLVFISKHVSKSVIIL